MTSFLVAGLRALGDLRSAQWHGRETMPQRRVPQRPPAVARSPDHATRWRFFAPWRLGVSAFFFFVSSVGAADKVAKVTYDDHLVPLLREKCFACHNQDRKSGGLRLNN